jgi:glycosyltransferase involved in cell wall biosynthesis
MLARSRARVVAVSEHTRDQLVADGLSADRVTVVENAVRPLPRHVKRVARSRLGIDPADRVVLCAARFTPEKRHDLLLEAWRRWPSPPLLLLAGDGPRRVGVEREVAASGLGERVRVLGDRDDVDWLLAACDAVVLPSDSEGLPVSVLEAMLAERPVVASAVGGLTSLDPESVVLVTPGSVPDLVEALIRVVDSPAAGPRLVGHALTMVRERFDPSLMRTRYRQVLDEATAEGVT